MLTLLFDDYMTEIFHCLYKFGFRELTLVARSETIVIHSL